MAEKPIIFSAPMVRSLLAGRKTQTRRVIKVQPTAEATSAGVYFDSKGTRPNAWTWLSGVPEDCDTWGALESFTLPYAVGDRLWLRESFVVGFNLDEATGRPEEEQRVWYRADSPWPQWYDADSESTLDYPPWKSPIHMPRWASRITLEVTEVRVQRLQEISEEDTIVEGVQCPTCEAMKYSACHDSGCFHSLQLFKELWNGLHGPGAWEANPWVAAISFKRIT